MIYSVSGFANTQGKILDYFWQIEIRSVNSRGLDIKIKAPDWIEELENSVRLRLKNLFVEDQYMRILNKLKIHNHHKNCILIKSH